MNRERRGRGPGFFSCLASVQAVEGNWRGQTLLTRSSPMITEKRVIFYSKPALIQVTYSESSSLGGGKRMAKLNTVVQGSPTLATLQLADFQLSDLCCNKFVAVWFSV